MNAYPNYYSILAVTPDADPMAIRKAYRDQMLQQRKHPDVGGDDHDAAALNEAYAVLRDPARRLAYDQLFVKHIISIPAATADPPPDERRRTVRVAYNGAVQIRLDHGAALYPGQCRDISAGGVAVRTLAPLTNNLAVTLILSDDPGLLLDGTVRWRRLVPQRFGIPIFEGGVEFRPLALARFREFCERTGIAV